MIEDDLRGLLADELDEDVYARLIPVGMPECVVVQNMGGSTARAGIRRAYYTISVMGVSADRERAGQIMRRARNKLVKALPVKIGDTHYYTAIPLADGKLDYKTNNGPKYVAFVDMEVGASL